ncbi:MAG: Imm1 family immunity protein [Phycisphaerae bacterium]
MNWTLDIEQQRQVLVHAEQLREQLIAAHHRAKHKPLIALLNAPDGATVAIGLGLERCVLNCIAAGGRPSRHATDDAAGDGLVQYTLAGQMSEVPLRGTVRFDDAVDTCVDFMKTGSISEKLTWEED